MIWSLSSLAEALQCTNFLNKNSEIAPEQKINLSSGIGIDFLDRYVLPYDKRRWLFQRLAGIDYVSRYVYVPAKQQLVRERAKVYAQAERFSLYDLPPQGSTLLKTRLFAESIFMQMGIKYGFNHHHVRRIPQQGTPAVAVFNHPFGVIDTLLAAHVLLRARPDIKFVANSLMKSLAPEAEGFLLNVDISGKTEASQADTMVAAAEYVRSGGMVVIFPDPTVPVRTPFFRSKTDQQGLTFKRGVGRILNEVPEAKIVMGLIESQISNSELFHLLGQIHSKAKLAVFIREFNRRMGDRSFNLTISDPFTMEGISSSRGVDFDVSLELARETSKRLERVYNDFMTEGL